MEVCPWHLYSSSPVENILALLDKDKLHGVRGQGQEGLCLPAAPYEAAIQRVQDIQMHLSWIDLFLGSADFEA